MTPVLRLTPLVLVLMLALPNLVQVQATEAGPPDPGSADPAPDGFHAPPGANTPLGQSVVLSHSGYGPNAYIEIEWGTIGYTRSCTQGSPDFFYPVADIYVVAGTEPTMVDATGGKNTVIGLGGAIFYELIGTTRPGGKLGEGVYSIIIDECQDGAYQPHQDAFFPGVVVVRLPADLPPIPDGFNDFKARALPRYQHYDEMLVLTEQQFFALDTIGWLMAATSPLAAYWNGLMTMAGYGNTAKAATLDLVRDTRDHYDDIYRDPPDPTYLEPTLLPPAAHLETGTTDPLLAATYAAAAEMDMERRLAATFLRAAERYQGADQDDYAQPAEAQARTLLETARGLQSQYSRIVTALEGWQTALAEDPRDLDAVLADLESARQELAARGLTPEERGQFDGMWLTRQEVRDLDARLRAQAPFGDTAGMLETLESLQTQTNETKAVLDAFIPELENWVDAVTLERGDRSPIPAPHISGPDAADDVTPATFSASSPTHPDALGAVTWDLDGDGLFDDATGPNATTTMAPGTRTVQAMLTTAAGSGSAYHTTVVTATQPLARPSTVSPPAGLLQRGLGASQTFTADLPADTHVVSWTVDGAVVGTSGGVDITFSERGIHQVGLTVDHASGASRPSTTSWLVQVRETDSDGDGWVASSDCDDQDPSIHPFAPDPLNGIDDDCDPATPDGGIPPAVDVGFDRSGREGDLVDLSIPPFYTTRVEVLHPDLPATPDGFIAETDWGDGTVTTDQLVADNFTTYVYGNHRYADDGSYLITTCVTAPTGAKGCDEAVINITNRLPDLDPYDLNAWNHYPLSSYETGHWEVSPDGNSVTQIPNEGPSIYASDFLMAGGYARIEIEATQVTDDDYIGFVLGYDAATDLRKPDSHYYLLDWKRHDQHHCGGLARKGLALSEVRGAPLNDCLFWRHSADAAGSVKELQRGFNFGHDGWLHQHNYVFEFEYSPVGIKVWVDGVLEIDHEADLEPGSLAFYTYSQSRVRFQGLVLDNLSVPEGNPIGFSARITDPGSADTHVGRISFGDGTPDETYSMDRLTTSTLMRATHTYLEDGTYLLETCATDDDDGTRCKTTDWRVSNLAPEVEIRPTLAGPPRQTIEFAWQDKGVLDTHLGVIDWGDGTVETLQVESYSGAGSANGSHEYASPGEHLVTVCITDDDGGEGCATANLTVYDAHPPETLLEPAVGEEGRSLTFLAAFRDLNPQDVHHMTIDWGDGTLEPLPLIMDLGTYGLAAGLHTYPQDGTYEVKVETCDGTGLCHENTTSVLVHNLPPVPGTDHAITYEGDPVLVDVLANDEDVPLDLPLRIAAVHPPSNGTTEAIGDQLRFTPGTRFHGEMTFTYTVTDGDGGSAIGTVIVDVLPDRHPLIRDDHLRVPPYSSVNGNVLANDEDDRDASITFHGVVQTPRQGTLDIDAQGRFTYVPEVDWDGSDRFVYLACDRLLQCDHATAFLVEETCGTDGFRVFDDTILPGTASGLIHEEVERRVARYDRGLGQTLYQVNCDVVVPVEDALDPSLEEVRP